MHGFCHADGYAETLVTGLWPSLDILPPRERAATDQRIALRSLRVACRVRLPNSAAAAPPAENPDVANI